MSDRSITEDALKLKGWVKDAQGNWAKPKRVVPEPVVVSREEFTKLAGEPEFQKRFQRLWRSLDGPEIVDEHRFHPGRKWRLDYAHLATKTGIELHGSVWTQGRHTRGGGFIGDREKMNAAQRLGWVVFELTPEMVNEMQIRDIIDTIKKRQTT